MADRLLRVLLEVVPKSTGAFQKAIGGTGPAAATQKDTSTYLTQITDKFSSMSKELARLNVSLRPELIAKQADLEMKLEKARDSHDKAMTKAKGGGGLLGILGGGTGFAMAAGAGVLAGGLASVGARSPATVDRFERALLDTTAVIGETFQPVMELATEGIQLFGDFLASVLPDAKEMRELLKPLSDSMGTLRDIMTGAAPVIKDLLIGSLKILGETAKLAADALKLLAPGVDAQIDYVKEKIRSLEAGEGIVLGSRENAIEQAKGELRGLEEKKANQLKSSRGMAATTASYVGGEERGRAAYAAAFASGATKTAQEKVADNTKEVADNTAKILEALREQRQQQVDELNRAREGR